MKIAIFRKLAPAAALLGLLLLFSAERANAVAVTYTFEQFTDAPTFPPPGGPIVNFTPLLNVAPDSGPASFQANFTSSPNPAAFAILNFQPNPLLLGNGLFQLPGLGGNNTLTITLNEPVVSVSLDFGTRLPATLEFISLSGSTSVLSTPQLGGPPSPSNLGGILTFSNDVPFSTFSLRTDTSSEFGIDNLTLRTVPDTSSTLSLSAVAALFLFGYHRFRRERMAA